MYSGSTLTNFSGSLFGGHQKIDRLAREHLSKVLDNNAVFPRSRQILHFEGKKGPDAIKRKSPAKDEPWHYYSPFDEADSELLDLIDEHYQQLVKELKNKNQERVAFEAAWLAHALVDGLTPAHHYPYEKEIESIWGQSKESRTTVKTKLIPPGVNRREQFKKTWRMWGTKGLMTTHGLFELGVAAIIAPLSMREAIPKQRELEIARRLDARELFTHAAREIAVLDIYERYRKRGWTTKLVYDIRHKLGPTMVQTVTLVWFSALVDAGLAKVPKYNRHAVKGY